MNDKKYGLATTYSDGLMSASDKTKLDNLSPGGGGVTGVKGDAESTYRTGNVNLTKGNIGLGNVDNTSDVNKPVSTATQTALNSKANASDVPFRFGIDDQGNYGYYKVGADTVTPFKSGSSETETVLWENANPSASMANNTPVTLSETADGYKRLRVYFAANTLQLNVALAVDFDLTNISQLIKGTRIFVPRMTIGAQLNASSSGNQMEYVRQFWFRTNAGDNYDVLVFSAAYNLGYTSTNTSAVIPYKISGIK